MSESSPFSGGRLLLFVVLVVGLLLGWVWCHSPDAELARTAREAVQLARETGSATGAAVLSAGRFRLLAVVGGVSIPLVIAYLIWRTASRSELDVTEVVEMLEQHELTHPGRLTAAPPDPRVLPDRTPQSIDRSSI